MKRWSQAVTEGSNALDLEKGVFTLNDPDAIAASLLNAARLSKRRKSSPYRSAMSMLNFYINRAGKKLTADRRRVLNQSKVSLRNIRRRGDT